jgi:hypothetical protein
VTGPALRRVYTRAYLPASKGSSSRRLRPLPAD